MPEPATSSPHLARATGRVAGRAFRRNRVVNATLVGTSRFFGSVAKVLHSLFLETMGLFFLLFAITGGTATWREYRTYQAAGGGAERVVLGAVFTLLFAYFAASSFWRARKNGSAK